MARQVDHDKTYTIRRYKDDNDQTAYTITVEGTASDAAAANEFDKGPIALASVGEIAYSGTMTLAQLETNGDTKLAAKAGT